MSLADHVIPALMALFAGPPNGTVVGVMPTGQPADWTSVEPLKGYSMGEQPQVPDSPWLWIINTTDDFPPQTGPDLEASTYRFTLRLLANHSNDPENAEIKLAALVDQVRQAFRSHIKMLPYVPAGVTTIAYARVRTGDWGYIPVGDVWYRSMDLVTEIVEKEPKQYGP